MYVGWKKISLAEVWGWCEIFLGLGSGVGVRMEKILLLTRSGGRVGLRLQKQNFGGCGGVVVWWVGLCGG